MNSTAEAATGALPLPSSQEENLSQKQRAKIRYPFWFGGSSSAMAACVTHPLDLVKVRLQTRTPDAPRNMSSTFVKILRTEGPLGVYSGISASLLRQLSYSTVRFAIYEEMKQRANPNPSFPLLLAMASSSGFLGGIAGNFADVINVRMQQDTARPVHQRRNYKHAVDGMVRMAREEGVLSWFRGWLPNSSRAAVQTASQLACYDAAKQVLLDYTPMKDNLTTQLCASFLAGLTAATMTNPIDVVKTQVMSSTKNQGVWELIKNLSRSEGPRWMFKGWVPSFLRVGPHTICIFLFLEMHRKVYRITQEIEN